MQEPANNFEEFADPALYDSEFGSFEPEGPFWLDVARKQGGPVLDIACGTGWLAIPLARMGLAVTGVDIVAPMLERARTKAGDLPIRWIEADARHLALDRHFALATLTGHAFQSFLTDEDQAALFATARAHLEPGGLLAFDTRNRRPADIETDGTEGFWHSFTDPAGRKVDVSLIERWDPAREWLDCETIRRWRDGSVADQRKRIVIRYTDAATLRNKLEHAGFDVEAQYGNWDRTPVTADSPEIITLARRR